jgi:hypothetical protein
MAVMTACRPEHAQPRCAYCMRMVLPITRTDKAGRVMPELVIDPTAILRPGRACPLYERGAA